MKRTMLMRVCLVPALLAALSGPLLAQAPPVAAAAPAGAPPGTVIEDEHGYKMIVPAIDPKKKPAEVAQLRIQEAQTRNLVWQVLAGSQPFSENRTRLDNYYKYSLFANFSQTHDAALSELPEDRNRLFRDHLERATGQVHDYLRDLVFDQMQTFVKDNYHPAVRFNAMLVISHLNDVEASRVGADKRTPEPMQRALGFIYSQFKNPDNSDAIRVAALIGLVRHLEWDNYRGPVGDPQPVITPAQRTAIVRELLALARQTDPPEGRSASGHEWLRRRAIEGLTHVASVKPDADIAAAMEELLKDEREPLAIRCAAATAIGQLAYQGPVKPNPKPTADELGYVALLACHKELTRVENMNKQEVERLARMQGGGSYGGSYGGDYGSDSGMGGMTMPGMPGGGGMSGLRTGSGAEGVYAGPRPGGSVRPKAGGGPDASGGMMPGMMSGMEGGYGGLKPADPKQYRFDYIRRRLRAQLYAVETALVGPEGFQKYRAKVKQQEKTTTPVAAVAAPAQTVEPLRGLIAHAKGAEAEHLKKVITGVENLARAVEQTTTELADLDKELRKQMAALEKTIKRKVAVVAPPPSTASDLPEVPSLPGVPDAKSAPSPDSAAPPRPMPATPPRGAAAPPAATDSPEPPAAPAAPD